MEGLSNRKNSITFVGVYEGKFSIKTTADDPDAVTRVNKNGVTVHEKYFSNLIAKLSDITVREHSEYGKQWEFHFYTTKDNFKLQLNYSSSVANTFLKVLPNLDLDEWINLALTNKIVDGKTKTSLIVVQNEKGVKHAYTKDQPNGLPSKVQKTIRGQEIWDDTDQLIFLKNMVDTDIIPKLKALNSEVASGNPENNVGVKSEVKEPLKQMTSEEADKGFDDF